MLKYTNPDTVLNGPIVYKIVLFCLSLILISGNVSGQKHLSNGNRFYSRNLFEEAIPYYLKEIEKGSYQSKNLAREKLADCYRLTGRFSEAEEMYKYLLDRNKRRKIPAYYLNYAKSLKSSAKYEEAAEQLKAYMELVPEDKMGPILLESCYQAQIWLDEEIEYFVKNFEQVNTPEPEFSAAPYNGGIVFSSSRRESSERKLINLSDDINVVRMDLYFQNLQRTQGSFDDTESFKEINSHMHESAPTFNTKGTEVYFTRTIAGKKNKKSNSVLSTLQVFHSSKDPEGEWSEPQNAFSFARDNFSVGQPSLSSDGKRIFFISDMPGGYGGTDIYYCDRQKDNTWGEPVNLGNSVNTFGHELFPHLEGRDTLYFSSDTHPGMGKLDIFRATRNGEKWEDITNMKPPINSIGNDFGITMYRGQDRGFFSSDRFNGMGAEDIYSFIRIDPMRITISQNEIIIPDLELYNDITHKIKNGDTATAVPIYADQQEFRAPLEAGNVYELSSRKEGFSFNKLTVEIRESDKADQLAATITSSRHPVLVNGMIQDQKTDKQKERGSIILLTDVQELEMVQVNKEGLAVFNTLLNAGEAYHLESIIPDNDMEPLLTEVPLQVDSVSTPEQSLHEEQVAEVIAAVEPEEVLLQASADNTNPGDEEDLLTTALNEEKVVAKVFAEVIKEDIEVPPVEETIQEPALSAVNSAPGDNLADSAMTISFSVQIGAYKKKVSPATVSRYTKAAKNLPLRRINDKRGYTLFQVGSFKEYRDADQALQTLLERGIREAFVVAYCNQERIEVTRARIIKQDILPDSDKEPQNYTTDLSGTNMRKTDIR